MKFDLIPVENSLFLGVPTFRGSWDLYLETQIGCPEIPGTTSLRVIASTKGVTHKSGTRQFGEHHQTYHALRFKKHHACLLLISNHLGENLVIITSNESDGIFAYWIVTNNHLYHADGDKIHDYTLESKDWPTVLSHFSRLIMREYPKKLS